MNIKFNIQETLETEIFYGAYDIYIIGGHYVKVNPNFNVQIVNLDTNEKIQLTENFLKARNYKFGKNAIKFYSFQINNYGRFRIEVQNFDDIIVRDSILQLIPFPFSIPLDILLFITGKRNKKVKKNLDHIEILIE